MRTSGRVIASARLIALLTLGSRVLGLARECAFSYFFSTSELLSAFRIAFMVPNLTRRLFGEGALSAAMIPVLTESLQAKGEESTRRFVGALLTMLVAVLALIVLAGEAVIAVWRSVQDDLALDLAAILLPYAGLICTVAVISGVLNVRRHFATPAAAPIILNLGILLGVLGGAIWADLRGVKLLYATCGGVLLAGVIQVVVVGGALRAISFFPIFSGGWRDPRIRTVGAMVVPMIVGMSAVQINSLVDYLIAYVFIVEDGERVGPAVLGYAQFLYQLPLGVFGIAVATAIFPVLSQRMARGDRAGMAKVLLRGIRLSLFIALPASVGLMFVSNPMVAALYQRGQFDAGDTQRVAGALFFYSLGIAAYFTQHLLVRAFYSMHDSRTPARIAMSMVGVNFLMNLSLVFVLQERGLALSTAVCAIVQVIFLALKLARDLPEVSWRAIGGGVFKMVLATGVMAAVLTFLTTAPLVTRLVGSDPVSQLITLVVAGVASYVLAARMLRIEELGSVLRKGSTDL